MIQPSSRPGSVNTTLTALLASVVGGLLVGGCQPERRHEAAVQPFVFRALQLRQRDAQGRLLWEISSPETRYDLTRRLAQARNLKGVLYREGKPQYRLTASTAVVINDGEVVQLEGPTRLERLDPQRPAVITAERVRWYPRQERMEIDRVPKAVQGNLELVAGLATFRIDLDQLELRRQPLLLQRGPEPVRLELGSVDWFPASGALQAKGPIRGRRRLGDGTEQRLLAPALSGNTLSQTIDLQAPVRLEDPGRAARLDSQTTRLNLLARTASSDQPFIGQYGRSRLTGRSFLLDGPASLVRIQGACRLQQPGDELSADRCQWNWTSGQVKAEGDVVLKRQQSGLESRASRLEGRIGPEGYAQFSSPSGQVRTRIQLPETPGRDGADGNPGPWLPGQRSGEEIRTDREPPFQL